MPGFAFSLTIPHQLCSETKSCNVKSTQFKELKNTINPGGDRLDHFLSNVQS